MYASTFKRCVRSRDRRVYFWAHTYKPLERHFWLPGLWWVCPTIHRKEGGGLALWLAGHPAKMVSFLKGCFVRVYRFQFLSFFETNCESLAIGRLFRGAPPSLSIPALRLTSLCLGVIRFLHFSSGISFCFFQWGVVLLSLTQSIKGIARAPTALNQGHDKENDSFMLIHISHSNPGLWGFYFLSLLHM